MDAENYSDYPINQFEEDNVLRELNKCLLAYRQNSTYSILDNKNWTTSTSTTSSSSIVNRTNHNNINNNNNNIINDDQHHRRLSPIGEGTNSPDDDVTMRIFIKQASKRSSASSTRIEEDINKRRSWLQPDLPTSPSQSNLTSGGLVVGPTASGRRGRFIILGSSGECLPVNRKGSSLYSSCDSSVDDDDEYHSAKGSVDSESDDGQNKYTSELDTPERRHSFAQKLREALMSESLSGSSDGAESYAVGISVAGSQEDNDIRLRRGGSRGFMLTEDSLDEELYKDSLMLEKEWLIKFRNKQNGPIQRKDTNESSKYSFSTEYSSELEEVYEQFSRWIDDPILMEKKNERVLDPRDEAVLQFASSLLKRTLSESFVGVPLTEGCVSSSASAEDSSMQCYQQKRNRLIMNPRSLSLELAKHKHRLAAQLVRNIF